MIDEARVRARLEAAGVHASVFVARSTGSTNDDAKGAAAAGLAAPAVFLAEEQTAGRGRSGNAWLARAGESVLMSVLLRPRVAPHEAARLTLAVGVAVADVLDGWAPDRVKVKWPNDVWVDDKKIAGILVEAQTRGGAMTSVIVGVGLNVEATELPDEIAEVATSLALVRGTRGHDRALIAADLALAIVTAVGAFDQRGLAPFLGALRARDALLGREVSVGEVTGVASGIDDEGRLSLTGADGAVTAVVAGHVIVR